MSWPWAIFLLYYSYSRNYQKYPWELHEHREIIEFNCVSIEQCHSLLWFFSGMETDRVIQKGWSFPSSKLCSWNINFWARVKKKLSLPRRKPWLFSFHIACEQAASIYSLEWRKLLIVFSALREYLLVKASSEARTQYQKDLVCLNSYIRSSWKTVDNFFISDIFPQRSPSLLHVPKLIVSWSDKL